MRNRLLLVGLAAAVALLLAAPALADHDDGATEEEHDSGELTALVAPETGRSITSLTDPVAEVVDGETVISAGVGSTLVVEEVTVPGVASWHVTVELDDVLKEDGGEGEIAKNKVSADSLTTEVVLAPDPVLNPGDQPTVTDSDNSANHLGAPLTLYTVTGQNTGKDYLATYTSTVDFTVDAAGYTGPLALFAAPFTVTVYQ